MHTDRIGQYSTMTSMANAVLWSLLLSCFVFLNQFIVAIHIRWGVCSTLEPFLTLYYVSFWTCELECMRRRKCQAISYWRLVQTCEMIALDDENAPFEKQSHCAYARKTYMEGELKVPKRCPKSDAGKMCDSHDGICSAKGISQRECPGLNIENGVVLGNVHTKVAKATFLCNHGYSLDPPGAMAVCQRNGTWSQQPICVKECPDLKIENGVVLGNVYTQGAKATFICNHGYSLDPPGAMPVCQLNRTWSQVPKCVKDCGDPPILPNVESVSAGNTREGAMRTYECAFGHIVKKYGVKTTQIAVNASCDASGTWKVEFECVENCPVNWKLLGTSCYYLTQTDRGMEKANQACKGVDTNTHLVIMETPNEMHALRDYFSGHAESDFAYAGARLTVNEWKWSDGTLVEYSNWDDDQPDNDQTTNCLFIRMSDFLWHDFRCNWFKPAFCELELI